MRKNGTHSAEGGTDDASEISYSLSFESKGHPMDQTKNAEINKRARAAVPSKFSHIPGWGIDMPIERRVGSPKDGLFSPEENGASWESPDQQTTDVKIFIST